MISAEKKIKKKQTKKTKKNHVKWNKKVYTFILLEYKHLTICNYKNFPFHFFYLQKIVLLKMEEEDMQGHPSRIPVQDLFLLLSFHRLELLYFGASYWLRNWEIFVRCEHYQAILLLHLKTVLVITHHLNI